MNHRSERTVKLAKLSMLAAISLVLVLLIRIPFPLMPMLEYDLADVPILIGGFAFGPLAGLALTFVVSFIQAFFLGGNGIFGFFMHFVATGAFVLSAATIYKKNKTRKYAAIGLVCGTILMTASMLLWNLLITPLFLEGVTMQDVMAILLTVFLPFNLLKAGLNAVITFATYKVISRFLH